MNSPKTIKVIGKPDIGKGSFDVVIKYNQSALRVVETPFGALLHLENGKITGEPGAPGFPSQHIIDKSMREIWHYSPILNDLRNIRKKDMNGQCRTCKYAPEYCRGGCRAAAYLDSKDLKGTDPGCFMDLIA